MTIHHTLRKGNQCVYFLAKLGAHSSDNFNTMDASPLELQPLLLADAMGIVFIRQ